jgi:aspartyl-tRNA(Asn)/glutamyl-tRNA(Gln) amidotransferase subunit B
MLKTGADPTRIVSERGLTQLSDDGALLDAIDAVLQANADKVSEYRNGKEKLFGFFVGQVMKTTEGKANPQKLQALLKQKLTS